jgi:hypothetical protein
MTVRPLTVLLALVAAGCLAGCSGYHRSDAKPLARFSSQTSAKIGDVRRIAVLPLSLGHGVGRSAEAIDQALAASLRELDRFEVVAVPAAQRDELLTRDPVLANGISSAELLRLRDTLRVDAVLLGRVDQYQGYDPIALGLTTHLVSCIDGSVLWSATGHFDGSRGDIQADIERWHHGAIGQATASIAGWRATLASPSLFCRYVGDRLAASVPYRAN